MFPCLFKSETVKLNYHQDIDGTLDISWFYCDNNNLQICVQFAKALNDNDKNHLYCTIVLK